MARSIGAVEPAGRDIGAVQSAYTPLLYRGLVSRWSLDEATGTRFDSYGENDLTPTGSPGNTTGVSGNAVQLVRSSVQVLTCAVGTLAPDPTKDRTIVAWVRLDSKPAGADLVIASNDYPGEILRYRTSVDRFEYLAGDGFSSADALGSPELGVWYMVVGRYKAATQQTDISVNAGKPNFGTSPYPFQAGGSTYYIGTRFLVGSGNEWDGAIDEVAVWNRYLSDRDIETLYGGGIRLVNKVLLAGSSNGGTSSATDFTGADLLAVFVTGYAGGWPTLSDSLGNTWTPLTAQDVGSPGNPRGQWYYCLNPVVGASQTFTLSGSNSFSSAYIIGFSGVASYSQEAGANGSSGSAATGNVTPGGYGHLLLFGSTVVPNDYPTSVSPESLTLSQTPIFGQTYGGGVGYEIQTTVATRNPTFTLSTSNSWAAATVDFAPATPTPLAYPYPNSLGAPDTVGGLRVWTMADGDLYQDSTLGTPATADTDPVGAWEDQTAFGDHLTQTTSGSRPLLKLAQLNGLPVVRFDGSNDYLSRVLSATIAQPGTVYLVGTVTVAGNYFMDGDSGGRWALADALGSAGSMGMYAGSVVEGVSSLPSTAVWTAVFNGASSELYKDGVLLASGDAGSQDLVKLFLGSRYSGTDPLNGDIAEVAVYDRVHGATRRATVIDGLTAKWIASGPAPFTATGTLTLGSVTISGSATFSAGTKTATGTLTLGHPTISGSATFTGTSFTGSGALAATKATVSGSATFSPGTKTATGTLTTGHPVLSGSATFSPGTHIGTGTLTLNHPTVSGSATFSAGTKTATGALTLGHPTLSGSATFTAPVYTATGTLTTNSATVSGTAAFATVIRQATGALSVTRVAVAGSATFVPKYTATGALVLGHPVLSGSATFAPPVHTATGTLTLGHVVVSGVATFIPKKTAAGDLVLGHPVISGVVGFEPSVGVGTGALVVGNAFIGGTATFVPDSGFDPPGDRGEFFVKPVQYARRISVKPNVYATRTFWSDPTMPAPTETLYMTDKESKTLGVSFAREGSVLDGEELTNPQVFIDPEPESNVLGEPEVIATGFKDSDGKIIKAGKGVKVRVQNVPAGTYTLTCRVATNSDPALEWACKLIVDESKGI